MAIFPRGLEKRILFKFCYILSSELLCFVAIASISTFLFLLMGGGFFINMLLPVEKQYIHCLLKIIPGLTHACSNCEHARKMSV